MRPRFWTSLVIFISAYAPLAFIVAAKDFDFEKHHFFHTTGSLCSIGIAIASVAVLKIVMDSIRGQHAVTIKTIKSRSGDLINYSIPYLVTFVTVDKFFETANLVAFLIFMALMFLLTWKTQSLFINPVLAIIGYGLYDVQFTENSRDREGVFLVKGQFTVESSVQINRLSQFLFVGEIKTVKQSNYEPNGPGPTPPKT